MTNRRLSLWRGLVPLSITLATAACTQPTPVIRQPYSNGGGSGDGGLLPGSPGTGGVPGSSLPPGSGTDGGRDDAGGSGTGGTVGAGGSAATGGASGAGGVTAAGGTSGNGGRPGSGGMSTGMGGASGRGGAAGNAGIPDAGRMDTGSGGSGGTTVMDAPLESSSLDVSPPPPVDMGGLAPGAACNKATWTVEASTLCTTGQCTLMLASRKEPRFAADGDQDTRYTSGIPQGSRGAETVTVTFAALLSITGLTITSDVGDGAAAYKIESSNDGRTFAAFQPPLEGTGSDNIMLSFPAKTMKALRITQTGTKSVPWWSVHEISVGGCTTP